MRAEVAQRAGRARADVHAVAQAPEHALREEAERLVVVDVEDPLAAAARGLARDGRHRAVRALRRRQQDLEGAAAPGLAARADPAAVIAHDAVHHGEPEAGALAGRLRGEERI